MVEDKSFNAFLKAKLEEDVAVPEIRLPRRPAAFWRYSTLIAASLAVACAVFCRQALTANGGKGESRVFAAIELLAAGESIVAATAGVAEESLAERLLAWQDAPFIEVAGM